MLNDLNPASVYDRPIDIADMLSIPERRVWQMIIQHNMHSVCGRYLTADIISHLISAESFQDVAEVITVEVPQ